MGPITEAVLPRSMLTGLILAARGEQGFLIIYPCLTALVTEQWLCSTKGQCQAEGQFCQKLALCERHTKHIYHPEMSIISGQSPGGHRQTKTPEGSLSPPHAISEADLLGAVVSGEFRCTGRKTLHHRCHCRHCYVTVPLLSLLRRLCRQFAAATATLLPLLTIPVVCSDPR